MIKTRVEPKLSYRGYAQDSNLNSFDQYLDFSATSFGERSDLGLNLAFVNDSTLTSELEDSGVAFINKKRAYFSMEPSWRYFMTPLMSVHAEYRFDGVQYEDSGENGLNDFEYQVASGDLERRLGEDSDIVIRGYYQRYKVIELTNKARSLGLEIGYKRRFSSRLEGGVFLGSVVTESTISREDSSSSSVSSNLRLSYKSESSKYLVAFTSGVVPSSTGVVYDQKRIEGRATSKMNESFLWNLDLLVQIRAAIGQNIDQVDRTYYRLAPGVVWRFNRNWSVVANYTFSAEKRAGQGNEARRNQIYFGVEYSRSRRVLY